MHLRRQKRRSAVAGRLSLWLLLGVAAALNAWLRFLDRCANSRRSAPSGVSAKGGYGE